MWSMQWWGALKKVAVTSVGILCVEESEEKRTKNEKILFTCGRTSTFISSTNQNDKK